VVFQSYALFPNMSVAENIGYRPEDPRRERSRARRGVSPSWSSLTGIRGLENRSVDQLSGGQRQRVACRAPSRCGRACCCSTSAHRARCFVARAPCGESLTAAALARSTPRVCDPRPIRGDGALGDRIVVRITGRSPRWAHPREIYFEPAEPLRRRVHRCRQHREGPAADGALTLRRHARAWRPHANGPTMVMIRPGPSAVTAPDAGHAGRPHRDHSALRRPPAPHGPRAAADRPLDCRCANTVTAKIGDRVGLRIDPAVDRLLPPEAASDHDRS